jgi:ATP-dependent DNA helicase RecG
MASETRTTPGRPLSYLTTLPVDMVKGISSARSSRLNEAGIRSVADLLLHAPRRYLDRSQMPTIARVPLGEEVTVAGVVESVHVRRLSRRRVMTTIWISDGTGRLQATFFNPYVKFTEGVEYALSGKAERWKTTLQMKSPDHDELEKDSLKTGRVVPVHPGIAKLKPFQLREFIANALRRSRPIHEVLPDEIVRRNRLVSRDTAIADIHFPEKAADAGPARRRLVFDELFRLEVALALRKRKQMAEAKGLALTGDGTLVEAFIDALPFGLTGAQRRVIDEIDEDHRKPWPMHRLLHGEVGSGKTVVAVASLLTAIEAGYQAAVMAPTEVLSVQHYLGIARLLESAGMAPPLDEPDGAAGTAALFARSSGGAKGTIRLGLLLSNGAEVNFRPPDKTKRSDVIDGIANGTIDAVVGTHTLIQEGVHFEKLGAAVVDEQHRFGVHQRVQLREKGSGATPDLLIMTATPIPRTLAMTLYGDLEVSQLDEIPAGRRDIRTVHVSTAPKKKSGGKKRQARSPNDLDTEQDFDGDDGGFPGIEAVWATVRREVEAGRQAFIVCPLVDDSSKIEAASAAAEHKRLQEVFPDLRLGLLHGQLDARERDEAMKAFRNGDTDILVATTVIEVGIDIPNASVMVIEDADRFGLNQLHQLRGRIGRGPHESTCILIADPTTDEARARIEAMVSTTDGFVLAEKDLEIRGQGTVFGTRQAGMADLKLANIVRDADLLIAARREAFALVDADPNLFGYRELRTEVRAMLGEEVEWLFVS